jgi:hypothetical protein
MARLARHLGLVAASLLAAGLPACGGGSDSGSSLQVGIGDITLTEINLDAILGPGGCTPLTPGVPDGFPTTPTEFAISGFDFGAFVGTAVRVRFTAVGGARPFEAGTSETDEVSGLVVSSTLVCGTTPQATICGAASVSATVEVILESGVADDSSSATLGPVFTIDFFAPTITSLSNPCVGSHNPTLITITGMFLGTAGDTVTVRFRSTENAPLLDTIFADGTATSIDVPGLVGAGGLTITTTTPRATNQVVTGAVALYNVSDDLEDASTQVFLANGSCSVVSPAATIQFARNEGDVTASTAIPGLPAILATEARQQFETEITVTGSDDVGCPDPFAPVGGKVTVTLAAPGGPAFAPANAFQLTTPADPKDAVGTANFDTVTGTITSPTTIVFRTPVIDAIVTPFDFVPVIRIELEDGTIIPVTTPFNWLARPFVSSMANLDAAGTGTLAGLAAGDDFHASVPSTLEVTGDNFDAVGPSAVQVYAADDGLDSAGAPVRRIGTGTPAPTGLGDDLGGTVVTATTITGEMRLDGGVAELDDADTNPFDGIVRYAIRVINGDGQTRDFCPADSFLLTGELDTAGALYADVNVVTETGGDADTNNNVSVAIDPASLADDFATPDANEVAAQAGMNIAVVAGDDPTAAAFFEGTSFQVYFSTDGGVTWGATTIDAALDGGDAAAFRNFGMVAYDAFGNLWLSYLYDDPTLDEARVWTAISGDQGATFAVVDNFSLPGGGIAPFGTLDRPCLAVGPAGGSTTDQAVYVSYMDLSLANVLVGANSQSMSGFTTFSGNAPVNAQPEIAATLFAFGEHARCAVGPAGELYVTWVDRSAIFSSDIVVDRDQDGLYAATFTWDTDTVVDTVFSPAAARPSSPDAGPPIPLSSITVVPTGAHEGRLVIAYEVLVPNTLGVGPDHTRVVVAHSDDAGYTGDNNIAVHQADTADQYIPAITADRVTGRLHISWYDTKLDDTNESTQRFAAASDGGDEWGDPLQLSDTSSAAEGGAFEFTDYGLYQGIAAHGGHVVAGWSGNEAPPGNATRMDAFVKVVQQTPTQSP